MTFGDFQFMNRHASASWVIGGKKVANKWPGKSLPSMFGGTFLRVKIRSPRQPAKRKPLFDYLCSVFVLLKVDYEVAVQGRVAHITDSRVMTDEGRQELAALFREIGAPP